MTTQRCVLGTVVGGIILFVVGYLIYGVAFVSFFQANAGSATGVQRESPDFVALAIGQILWGGLLTLVLGWTRTSTVGAAVKTGAIVGLLFFLGNGLTLYATTNISTLNAAIVDAILAMILFAIAAAAIVPVLGRSQAQHA
jgi:hypothetical protein